jgi:hypothetical protein
MATDSPAIRVVIWFADEQLKSLVSRGNLRLQDGRAAWSEVGALPSETPLRRWRQGTTWVAAPEVSGKVARVSAHLASAHPQGFRLRTVRARLGLWVTLR